MPPPACCSSTRTTCRARPRSISKILRILTAFWMIVVVGGYARHPGRRAHVYPPVREATAARAAQPAVRSGTRPAGLRRGAEIPRLSHSAASGAVHLQQLLGRQHGRADPGGHRRGRGRWPGRPAQDHHRRTHRVRRAYGLLAEPRHVPFPGHRHLLRDLPAGPARPPGRAGVAARPRRAGGGDPGGDAAGASHRGQLLQHARSQQFDPPVRFSAGDRGRPPVSHLWLR